MKICCFSYSMLFCVSVKLTEKWKENLQRTMVGLKKLVLISKLQYCHFETVLSTWRNFIIDYSLIKLWYRPKVFLKVKTSLLTQMVNQSLKNFWKIENGVFYNIDTKLQYRQNSQRKIDFFALKINVRIPKTIWQPVSSLSEHRRYTENNINSRI